MLQDWFTLGFLRRALAAGSLVAASCALLSPYIVLRRMAFAGHGLAHAAFGGAALALLLGGNLSIGGALFACLLALVLAYWTRKGEVSEDSAIGILVTAAMALGVIFLSLRRTYTQDVFSFLFGNILAVLPADLIFAAAVSILTFAVVLGKARSLRSATFHEELARVEGVPVEAMRFLLLVLVALNVVAAMKVVGAILVTALLVVPGSWALLLGRRFGSTQAYALAIGIGSVPLGMFLSYLLDLPSGAVITLVLFVAYSLTWTIRTAVDRRRRARLLPLDQPAADLREG
ncbi:MAG: metal ABC transporter permease [Candidatus Eisenbacteria bacterium]|nr:metal ABC transporter permease [Candidatus Eisenbacteria bacterium]